jgi:hypothetical protein
MTIIRGADIVMWTTPTWGDHDVFSSYAEAEGVTDVKFVEDDYVQVTGRLDAIIKASQDWFADEEGTEQVLSILEDSILIRRV